MSTDAGEKLQAYKEKLMAEAELLLTKSFPERIIVLNDLLATPMFNRNRDVRLAENEHGNGNGNGNGNGKEDTENNDDNGQPPAKKARQDVVAAVREVPKLGDSTELPLPCNKLLCEMIDLVKPLIRNLVEESKVLKMWVLYMMPKIEDGNNFGVAIQEHTITDLETVLNGAANLFSQLNLYFQTRANVVSKVLKYPLIDDYRRAVIEVDEKEYLALWLAVVTLRDHYILLHEKILKNIAKIKKPRSSSTESLY